MSPVVPESTPAAGRDRKGRFTVGNTGGPGNPFARRVAQLRKVLLDDVSDDDLRAAVAALKRRAAEGDVAAMKLLFQYTLGRPTESVDPDRVELDQWQLVKESALPLEQWVPVILRALPTEVVNRLVEALWPFLQQGQLDQFQQAVFGTDPRTPPPAKGASAERSSPPSANGGNGARPARPNPSTNGPTGEGRRSQTPRAASLLPKTAAGRPPRAAGQPWPRRTKKAAAPRPRPALSSS